MKLNPVPNMKRLFILIFFAAVLAPCLSLASQDTWVNNGTIVEPPAIDATNVINNGTISVATTMLFDTSNTLNVTNTGTMLGAVGFRFDTAPRNSSGQLIGLRKPSANFHNRISGTISAFDGSLLGGYLGSGLIVNSTNIVNQGLMTVGAGGLLQLFGNNVNLSRGGVGVVSIADSAANGSYNDPVTGQFQPDVAISDTYWGQTNVLLQVNNLITPGGIIVTPRHQVETTGGAGGYQNVNVQWTMNSYYYDAISNVLDFTDIAVTNIDGSITNFAVPTNIVQQAAFVGVVDPSFQVAISWVPTTLPTNDYFTAVATVFIPVTNVLTGQVEYDTVFFEDTLAGELDRGVLNNILTTLGGLGVTTTRRPQAYILSRLQQAGGFGGNALVGTDFFYPPGSTTNRVTGEFAGYSATIDNIVIRPPSLPSGNATNYTGRVEVQSQNLDLSRARIRGEGLIWLQASHLISSSNAAVDCENLSLDFGSTNGLLTIQNITKTTVERVRGDVRAWSGQWSNTVNVLITNYTIDPSGTNPPVYAPLTNVIGVQYHMLAYDLSGLGSTRLALVQEFRASATNVVMKDQANVVLGLLIKGQSFTLNGSMDLSQGVPEWVYTNAPTLQYFTNTGTLTIANEAHFGDDGPSNYLAFVNRGLISSVGQSIDSDYVLLGGTNFAQAAFYMSAVNAAVENGRINAQNDVYLSADTLKLNRALVQSSGRLYVDAPSALFDNGPQSSNILSFSDGITLSSKPSSGDLLGTSVRSAAPVFASVSHVWPGLDFGATNLGFTNNIALGRMTLMPAGADPYFVFIGTGNTNGMYVDYLDLSQLTDYANQIEIEPNIIIYYAAAKLSFTPPGGLTPEEYLNGQFGGHLQWVSSYAGANSSVDVVINGNQTIKVNRALRNSTVIDSDADGIPNFYDPSPFDGVMTTLQVQQSPPGFKISWLAAPKTLYRVEYRSSALGAWTVLTEAINPSTTTVSWSVVDTNISSGLQRYYRVSYNPNGP